MQKDVRVRVSCVFYTWHPDFIDNKDGTYKVLKTGRWIAEWNVKSPENKWQPQHMTAVCKTEALAKKLIYILSKKHEKYSAFASVDKDDICLKSGIFVKEKGVYKII